MTTPPVALSVAGTDSGGAAGLAADLATFAALGVHGACVVAAVTAQDTTGVHDIHAVPVGSVREQLAAVYADLPVAAVKTGMLGSAAVVEAVAERVAARGTVLVVDPVLVATSGALLGDDSVVAAYQQALLPVATVATPNAGEARTLLGLAADEATPEELAVELARLGPAVVVTGGPGAAGAEAGAAAPAATTCTDWLARPGAAPVPLTHSAVATANDHGTGCTFSAALAALLARDPRAAAYRLEDAVRQAAAFTTSRLALSRHWELGRGRGPVAHVHTAPVLTTHS